MSWEIEEDVIHFAAQAQTTGWFAIALAGNAGNMVDADAMIGIFDGSPIVEDYKIDVRYLNTHAYSNKILVSQSWLSWCMS